MKEKIIILIKKEKKSLFYTAELLLLIGKITLFGDQTKRTEVRHPCNKRDNPQIEPLDPRHHTCDDQSDTDHDPKDSTETSDFVVIDFHNVTPLC